MASTSSSNKRARSTSPSSSPPVTKARVCRYVVGFEKTSKSDVIIESSDGHHFASRKAYLLASLVFEDILLAGTDDSSEKLDGLPIITLEERHLVLQRFLSFVHPSASDLPLPFIPPGAIDQILRFCDKYDAPLVGKAVAQHYFPLLFDECDSCMERDNPNADPEPGCLPDLLAVALIHLRFGTTRYVTQAIRRMGYDQILDYDVNVPSPQYDSAGFESNGKERTAWRVFGVEDIDVEFLKRLDVRDIAEFCRLRTKVITSTIYDWNEASLEHSFELRH